MSIQVNVDEFNRGIEDFAADSMAELVKIQKKVVFVVLKSAAMNTPVLRGRARGGWQTTINTTIDGENGRLDKTGAAVMAEARAVLGSLKPFSIVYISNNVVYIIFLEEGTEKMKPYKMAALAMQRARRMFQ